MHYDRFSWLDAPNLHSNLYICTMQMSLAWRHQAKFGDSVIKYLKQLEDVAHEKNIFIYQNERKIDMRMTSDQMEQSPLDPENVRSLKHTGSGSGVSRFQTVHFFSLYHVPIPCDSYIVSTGPCMYMYKDPDKE